MTEHLHQSTGQRQLAIMRNVHFGVGDRGYV